MKNLLTLLAFFTFLTINAQSLSVELDGSGSANCIDCSGSISVNVTGGTPPYMYKWSDPSFPNTAEVQNVCPGGYVVTVTDASGTSAQGLIQIYTPGNINIVGTTTPASCYGLCNGSINVSVTGGMPPYSYLWTTGTTTQDISGLCEGSYQVTVSDAGGCTSVSTFTVISAACITASVTTVGTTCGVNSGTIDLTVSGGTPGYTYTWSNGATTQDISGNSAGTYTVTITDSNGCTKTVSATVASGGMMTLSTTVQNATPPANNGSISLSVSGGSSPYVAVWQSAGGFTNTFPFTGTLDLPNLSPGTYCVTVTDAQNCSATKCVTVGSDPSTTCSVTITDQGGGLLVAQAASSPGTQITYQWSTVNGVIILSVPDSEIYAGSPGTYCVTITNTITGCTATACYNYLGQVIINGQITPDDCGPACTGSIKLDSISGPASGNTCLFSWSNGASTPNITNLCAGTYTVTVYCGQDIGTKVFLIAGGNGTPQPVTISSSNPAYCNSPNNLPNSTVCEKVCPDFTVTYSVEPPPGCVNLPSNLTWTVSGAVSWTVSADTREVTVNWGGAGPGLVSVSGASGQSCFSGSLCIDVTAEPKAKFTTNPAADMATGILQVCKGQNVYFNNESIDAEIYEWQFSDNQSNTTVVNAEHEFNQAGTFTVLLIARTECLCSDSAWLTVEVLDAVTPLLDCVNTTCPGEQTTYTADASCGSYTWNISPNGTITGGGGPADNSVTVIWNDGSEGIISLNATACSGSTCPATAVSVIPILNDDAEIEGRSRVCPNNEETYKITLFEGSNYVWSIKPGTGTIIEGQGRDKIVVAWKGSNIDTWVAVEYDNCYLGCTGRDTLPVLIRPPFTITGDIEKCDGTSGTFQTIQVPGGASVMSAWQLFNPSGQLAGSFSNGGSASIGFNAGPGTYRIFAVPVGAGLNNTCSDSTDWKVRVKPNPPAPLAISGPDVFCPGTPVSYSANTSSGLYNIKWDIKNSASAPVTDEGPSTLVTFTSGTPRWVAARQISTDGLGCLSDSVRLLVTEVPDFQINGPQQVCKNDVGTYTVPVIDGISYFWSVVPATAGVIRDGQNTASLEVYWVEPGDHAVVATACGKSATYNTTVNNPPVPDPVYPQGICPGNSATVNANGFFTNYQWKRENGQIIGSGISAVVSPGKYALAVTDANGCKGTTEFSIIEYPNPNVRISTIDKLTYCNETIVVNLTALVNADGNFQYQWFHDGATIPETGATMTADQTGGFSVQVTNEYGCTGTDGPLFIYENCGPPPPPGGNCNCNSQTCPGINFDIIPTAECDSFRFVTNMVIPYQAGSENWRIRRQGFGTLYNIDAPSCGFRFPNAGQFIAQLTITLPDGSLCQIAKEVRVLAHAQFASVVGCPGAPTSFNDESTFLPGAESGSTWHWDFNDFASANTDTSSLRNTSWAFANPLVYNVNLTITAPTGCTTTATGQVNIPDLPVIAFLPQTFTCAKSAIPMAIVNQGTFVGIDWVFGDPASGSLNIAEGVSTFHIYNTPGSFNAIATVTNISGCQQSATYPVTVTPNNLAGQITPSQNTICEGKSITLTAPSGGTGATYLWSDNTTATTLLVTAGGTYSVTISTPEGCTYAPPPKVMDVNPAPDGIINALLYNDLEQLVGFVENEIEVCKGEDVYLEVRDNGTYQYTWSGGLGAGDDQSFTEDRGNLLAVGTYNYAVTITNGTTGCTAVTPMFTVDVHPTPEGFSATTNQGCAGTLSTVSYVGPQPPDWQYFWNNGEVGTSFQTLDPGHFFVKVVNQFGCRAESNKVTIHPGPNIAAIPGGCHIRCRPDTLCFAPMPEITSWQWYFEGTPIPGATTQQLIANETGSYYVAVSDVNGCTAISEPLDLTLYTGYGDVLGKVWSDVNNNGIIDGGDTLLTNVPVLLWRNDTLQFNQQSGANGSFTFANILATNYSVSVDSTNLPPFWEIVIGEDDAQLVGCDSKDNVRLLVHIPECQPQTQEIAVSVCPGTSYDYFGTMIPAGTSQEFTYTNVLSCDSIVMVNVAAVPTANSTRTEQVCPGSVYNFNGTDIPVGGSQTFALTHPVTGCDSMLTIAVTALPMASSTRSEQVCVGAVYNFNGTDIPVGGSQTFALTHPVTGCDSMLTIAVMALPTANSTRTEQVCPGSVYNFNGTDIPVGGSQTFALTHPVTGCDSMLTIAVTALPTAGSTRAEQVCPGSVYNFNGTDIPVGGSQTFALTHPVTGCDSMLTIAVTALPTASSTQTEQVCAGAVYNFNGTDIPVGSSQTFALTHPVTGCDSMLTIAVTALPTASSTRTEQVCAGGSYNFNGTDIPAGGTATVTLTHPVTGCDSLLTIVVEALPVPGSTRVEVVCPGSSFDYNGTDIPAGSALTVILTDAVTGCDSSLTIEVEALPTAASTRTERVCPGAVYSFMGNDIPVGGSGTFVLSHPTTGCDSMVTILVAAHDIPQTHLERSACEGDFFIYNGTSILAGTVQNVTLTNPATGCDSVVTVSVAALPLGNTDISIDLCPGEKYTYNGLQLDPGAYEFHFTTHQGECDSVVYLNINGLPDASFNLAAEKSCFNTPTGTIAIENFTGGAPSYEFSNDGQNWQDELIFNDLPAGTYTITARDANNCVFIQTAEVLSTAPLNVVLPTALLIPCDTPMVEIKPLLSGDLTNLHWTWNTGDTTASVIATDAAEFSFTIQNECESITRSTKVSWAELPEDQDFVYVPNTVAPEDEKTANAIFKSFFVPGVEVLNFRMEVFDRWGDLIWRGFDVNDGWDTRNFIKSQKLADVAVYVWWVKADIMWCGRQVQVMRKGDVTVLR